MYDYYNLSLIILGLIIVIMTFNNINYKSYNNLDTYFKKNSECNIKSIIYVDNIFIPIYSLLLYNLTYYKNTLFRNILKITLIIHITLDLLENQILYSIYKSWKDNDNIDKDQKSLYEKISILKWFVASCNFLLVFTSWYIYLKS